VASNLITAILGKQFRSVQVDRLLYLTDGLTRPKMFDGTDLVNWGIDCPATAPVAAASSTGLNDVDLCELRWTSASTQVEACDSAWTLDPAWSVDGLASISLSLYKEGSASASFLFGTSVPPLSSNSVLMLHGDGSDGDTTTVDSSASEHSVTFNGTTELDNAQFKFGTTSFLFNGGTSDYLTVPDSSDWDFGTGDYTIECQFRISTMMANNKIYTLFYSISGGKGFWLRVYKTGGGVITIGLTHNATAIFDEAYTFVTDTWYHIRATRSSGVAKIFVNGVQIGGDVAATQDITGGGILGLGGIAGLGAGNYFIGHIDEIRIDKGVALSTSAFLPPTEAYGNFIDLDYDPLGVTGLVAYKDIGSIDLSGYWGIQFWIRSSKETSAGDLELVLYDSGSAVAELERISCPALLPDVWTQIKLPFTDPATLTTIQSLGLWLNADLGKNAVYLDDIRALRCKITLDTSIRTEGASSIKIEVPGNIPDNTLLAYYNHTAIDFSGDAKVFFDVRSNVDLGYQTLQFLLDDTANCVSPTNLLYIDPNLAKDTWHPVGLTLSTPMAGIVSHGLKLIQQNQTPCTIWIDNIRRGAGAAGNLSGRYFAWVSFYSSKYDRESDLSPISNVVTAEGQAISLSSIPVSTDSQVDMRRIYRSAAGGTVPYLDQTIKDNTTTVATLIRSDISLLNDTRHPSGEEGSGKFNPPPAFKYMTVKDNRIIGVGAGIYSRGTVNVQNASATFTFNNADLDETFVGRKIRILGDQEEYLIESVNAVAGTAVARPIDDLISGTYKGTTRNNLIYQIFGDENTIYTSYIDDFNVPRLHGFPLDQAQTIEGGKATDLIMGIGLVGGAILIPKKSSTFVAEGTYPPYTIGSPISDTLGCVSHNTIQTDLSGRAVWLSGKSGLVFSDGFNVVNISKKMRKIFDGSHELGLNISLYSEAHAIMDVTNNRYYLFCASKNSSRNDVIIVVDMVAENVNDWAFYYFTGVEAVSSMILYDENSVPSIYIGDYEGIISRLEVGYYDGISLGTLRGNPTSATVNTLTDTSAKFFTNGSGLAGIPLVVEDPDTGETWTYTILSNTGTVITIDGVFEEIPTITFNYYVGGYVIAWKSKVGYPERATDEAELFDSAINYAALSESRYLRVKLNQKLSKQNILDYLADLGDTSEKSIMLVATRVPSVQWDLSGVCHGEEIKIHALGIRFIRQGVV